MNACLLETHTLCNTRNDCAGDLGINNFSLTPIPPLPPQWNIADYLYQNRATLHDSLEALKSETSQTSYTSSLETSFIKSVRNSSLPVFNSVWMLLFKSVVSTCVSLKSGHWGTMSRHQPVYSCSQGPLFIRRPLYAGFTESLLQLRVDKSVVSRTLLRGNSCVKNTFKGKPLEMKF